MKKDSLISAPKLWTVLARCYSSVAAFAEQSVSSEDLGLSDFAVLEALLHKGPLTISAIGRKVLLANASMTSAIDRLEERGLVVRKSEEEDRRVRLIHLTAKGRALVATIFDRHQRQLEALMAALSQAERQQLYRGLKKLGLTAQQAAISTFSEKKG